MEGRGSYPAALDRSVSGSSSYRDPTGRHGVGVFSRGGLSVAMEISDR